MNTQKRKAIGMGMLGLVLIILGIKSWPVFLAAGSQPFKQSDGPVLLFFSVDEPCECMRELTRRAEQQMANWPAEQRGRIPLIRIAMEQRKDLEAQYRIFRAPCLVLVDAQDQIAWRQDYPQIAGDPFKLEELEAVIATFERVTQ